MRCNGLISGDTRVCVDEETMVGWFANALMRGYDEHRWKAEREAASGGKSEQADKVLGAEASKFPGTLAAEVWASRCTAWFGAFKVPDLAEWFQAALSHGFREGEAAAYKEIDKAQIQRDLYGPVVPGTRAPEPPGVEERLPRCEAERGGQRGRLDACECRTLGLDAPSLKASCDRAENRIHYLEKRVEKLEKAVRPEPETERNPLGICGLRAEMFKEWVGARQRIDVLEARLERIGGGPA